MNSELVDEPRLRAWLDSKGLEADKPLRVEPLSGGASNAMFVVSRGPSQWVLRRPKRVAIDRANQGMEREYAILAALHSTAVPHPKVVALCDNQDVLGCTFYLMEKVDGVSPFPLPAGLDNSRLRAQLAFSVVDALAALHQVNWREAGLEGFGHPERFHERQVERWRGQLASYNGREMPGFEKVAAWINDHVPNHFEASIMHGDYHMFNILISPNPPGRVIAILDWETATIGDPLLDLAGLVEIWCSLFTEGWPSREEMVDRYRTVRDLPEMEDLTYYEVLYNFRLTVLLEGIYQRSIHDPDRDRQDGIGERAMFNLDRAVELVTNAGAR
jgi:aminoglycoside phosphotransferase (APT) family kinase protein